MKHLGTTLPTGRIFVKFDIRVFFDKMEIRLEPHQNMKTIKVTLDEDKYTFLIIYGSVLLTMRNSSEKKVVEEINKRILCSVTLKKYSAVHEIFLFSCIPFRCVIELIIYC
jgi:hypothetical protein